MNNFKKILNEGSSNKYPMTMRDGTKFVNYEGYEIRIDRVDITEMHRPKPQVLVSYFYTSPDGKKGHEVKYLDSFKKEIVGK